MAKKTNFITYMNLKDMCKKQHVFTATPNTNMTKIYGEPISNYKYADAVADKVVLPFNLYWYDGEDGLKQNQNKEAGIVIRAFNTSKKEFNNAKVLVCGTSLESNQILFNNLCEFYKNEIEDNKLVIVKLGSESETEDEREIAGPQMMNEFGLMNEKDYYRNIIKKLNHEYINRDVIVIHCQMVTAGIDVPTINSVCIFGSKSDANLYQSVMRGCRISGNENHFNVFSYIENKKNAEETKEFYDSLFKFGGIDIIKAIKMPEEVGTKKGKKSESTALKIALDQWLKMKEAEEVNKKPFDYRKILGYCK